MATAFAMLFATPAFAEEKPVLEKDPTFSEWVCTYKVSDLFGSNRASDVATGAGAIAGFGILLKRAGFYTMTHAVTGATMLGSTEAGSSAAGTVGIIAGTGNGIGAVGAFFMSPVTIMIASGVAVHEAYCYFTEDSDGETPE